MFDLSKKNLVLLFIIITFSVFFAYFAPDLFYLSFDQGPSEEEKLQMARTNQVIYRAL
jgi:hypothetical protein